MNDRDLRQCNGTHRFDCKVEASKYDLERFSLGIFAGYWCDECWPKAGYRMEGPEGFDPMDAGESYEEIF